MKIFYDILSFFKLMSHSMLWISEGSHIRNHKEKLKGMEFIWPGVSE